MEEDPVKTSRSIGERKIFLAREGQEKEVVELSPGVSVQLDDAGQLIGVEVFKASCLLKGVIKIMEKRLQAA
jgi:uncharacterized protein YuzE